MSSIKVDEKYCKGCGLCVTFCPQKLVRIADHVGKQGYRPAEFVDSQMRCTACGLCVLVCPDAAITVYRKRTAGGKK
jgi:2-oxoglutarate ferredoxin oxidoreductase subunit delta